MKSLKRRTDEFSVQYTLEGSKRFFIRVDTDKSRKGKLIFTDLSFEKDEDCFAVKAIHEVMAQFADENTDTEICDIAPNYQNGSTPNFEVVSRYDKICEVMEIAMLDMGYRIEQSHLEYRLDRFDIILSSTRMGKPL